jgi:excinuclease ABC subunit C
MTTEPHPLKARIAAFPKQPGVYIMKDFDEVIIYIGKAKDLRARVKNYFGVGDGRIQIQYLIKKVRTIDYIVTQNEGEALLLERELIHKHKPRYNIRLKDDKAYISVRVNRSHPWPRLETVRRIIPDGSEYYGPYINSYKLRDLLEVIKRVSPLRTCTDAVFSNRSRPCLEYEIKRCAGPCCLPVDRAQYEGWLDDALLILEGKIEPILDSLEKQMEFAASDLRFEEAAALRDRMEVLKSFHAGEQQSLTYDFTCDVFGLYREEDLVVVAVMRSRDGRLHEVESYSLKDVQISNDELLEAVIPQYYEGGHDIPAEIVLPLPLSENNLLARYFEDQFQRQVTLTVPDQGAKHRLVRICELNAKQAFQNKFFSEARFDAVSEALFERFQLRQAPRTIECVDISNFQGSDIVGAIVAFKDGLPDRSHYRRYTISFSGSPNDFEAIHEVVTRRLTKAQHLPDLLIIDGGAQQLRRALDARDALGLTLDIISLAKIKVDKRVGKDVLAHTQERIFVEGAGQSIPLDESDPLTQFLQRVRDEVHRYVITFHRQKRKARVFRSLLDDIPGVGEERKRRLLAAFPSLQAIAEAPTNDVATAGRMPLSLAEKIKKVLRENLSTDT